MCSLEMSSADACGASQRMSASAKAKVLAWVSKPIEKAASATTKVNVQIMIMSLRSRSDICIVLAGAPSARPYFKGGLL